MIRVVLLSFLLMSMNAVGAEFSLSVVDIASSAFNARGIKLLLPMDGSANLQIANLKVQQREFRNVRVRCGEFVWSSVQLSCRNGRVDAIPTANLTFSYGLFSKQFQLALNAAGGESWQAAGYLSERGWQISAQLRNAQSKRLASWLPAVVPIPTQGTLNGTLHVGGDATGANILNAEVRLAELGFSDVSGLHAAEKLRGNIKIAARRDTSEWRWQGSVDWQSGALFWQPLYLTGAHQLTASGRFDDKALKIEQAEATLPDVGNVQFSAVIQQGALQSGTLHGDKLALNPLFEVYAKPFLAKGTLAESALYGHAEVDVQFGNGALQRLQLSLHEAGISDAARRFALLGVNTVIDWRADARTTAEIAFAGGALLGAPLGGGQWRVGMRGLEFDVLQAVLPILDGQLELRDFHLHQADKVWHWNFSASLAPISMLQFSTSAGWPKMLGSLSGQIPRVSYDGSEINVEGALLFNVFDGSVVATQLKLADAFARTPRLSGNLAMRNLDLDLLTRTFSFGNMQGRLDADVNNLQLQDWQPQRFDARVYSSAGRYPKKISQKAVQNISALGGSGAAAAIQRSFLGVFENFGYDRIGWRCVLRNGMCTMGGIEESNQASYSLIKGGGIPAINVMGYNRAVSWGELTTRLKRVTQDNVKPIVE